jgi:AraC-like DNA-binding protein
MDIEGTAQNLDVGPRTLQRRLQREGASYRDLVEAARRERASALLIETSERVADIAVALGYSSPSHFVRAFRRWTGNTPNTFRQRQA